MTFATIFVFSVLVLYLIVCLAAGALCGKAEYKNSKVYFSVSCNASYTRFMQYVKRNPQLAHRLICINNLKDEALSNSLKANAEKYGFTIID